MPTPNLFPKRKTNPLMMMLQQEPPVGPTIEQGGLDPNSPAVRGTFQPTLKLQMPLSRDADMAKLRQIQKEMVGLYGAKRPLFSRERWETSPMAGLDRLNLEDLKQGDPLDFFKTYAPKIMDQPYMKGIEPDFDTRYGDAQKLLAAISQNQSKLTPEQEAATAKINALPDAYTPQEKMSLLGTDKAGPNAPTTPGATPELDALFSVGSKNPVNSLLSQAIGGTQELVQKYGNAAQQMEAQKQALQQEFQRTPELDQLISQTRGQLDQARATRKKPGLGEFLTMALMNLSGMNPRNSADMVLGLGEHREREGRLEDRLAQLEGGRASAKIGGRRELRLTQQQDRYKQLESAIRRGDALQKQRNEDREFSLKQQGQNSGLLRALAGQEAQIISGMDKDAAKAAAASRAKLKQALGIDDTTLQKILEAQRQQQTPKDDRQSRMFGGLIGGEGYA